MIAEPLLMATCHAKSPGGIFHHPPAIVSPPLSCFSSSSSSLALPPTSTRSPMSQSACQSTRPLPSPPLLPPSPTPHLLIHSLPAWSCSLFWPSLCSAGTQIMSDIHKPGLARITFIGQIPTLARKQISSAAPASGNYAQTGCFLRKEEVENTAETTQRRERLISSFDRQT